MKKLFSLVLTLMLILSLGLPSLAEETQEAEKELVEMGIVTEATYEGGKIQGGTLTHLRPENGMVIETHENTDEDSPNKYYLKITRDPVKDASVLYAPSQNVGAGDKFGIFQYEFDIMIPGDGFWGQSFTPKLFWDKERKSNGFASGVAVYGFSKNGEVTFNGTAISEPMENDKWYHFKIMYDTGNSETIFYLDGEKIHNAVVSKLFYGFHNIEMYPSSKGRSICLDNIKASLAAYKYSSSASGVDNDGNTLSDGIDYRTPRIALSFTEMVLETDDNISSDIVKLKLGDVVVESDLSVSDDGKTIYITPQNPLIPSTEYTVSIASGFRSFHGLEQGSEVVHKILTCKPAFSVSNIEADSIAANDVFNANVTISNKDSIDANALLLVASYDENGYLISIGAANVLGTEHGKVYSIELKAPDKVQGSKVKALLLNSFSDQSHIDEFELTL